MFDPKTFGDTRAAVNLADMLNNADTEVIRVRKIGKFFHKYSILIRALEEVQHPELKKWAIENLINEIKAYDHIASGEEAFFSHAKNVLISKIRKI